MDIFQASRNALEPVDENAVHHSSFLFEEDCFHSHVFVCWRQPKDLQTLHQLLQNRIERTLLAELCAHLPFEDVHSITQPSKLILMVFPNLQKIEPALEAFAMASFSETQNLTSIFANIRGEAQRESIVINDFPSSVWKTDFIHPSTQSENIVSLQALQKKICMQHPNLFPWGHQPGKYFHLLNQVFNQFGMSPLEPSLRGIREMERLMISSRPMVIRWIPSTLFLALCDMIAIVMQKPRDQDGLGLEVQWADCTADIDGFCPPPMIRVRSSNNQSNDWVHLPLALQLLRWYVMPLQKNEKPASFADWLLSNFNS